MQNQILGAEREGALYLATQGPDGVGPHRLRLAAEVDQVAGVDDQRRAGVERAQLRHAVAVLGSDRRCRATCAGWRRRSERCWRRWRGRARRRGRLRPRWAGECPPGAGVLLVGSPSSPSVDGKVRFYSPSPWCEAAPYLTTARYRRVRTLNPSLSYRRTAVTFSALTCRIGVSPRFTMREIKTDMRAFPYRRPLNSGWVQTALTSVNPVKCSRSPAIATKDPES